MLKDENMSVADNANGLLFHTDTFEQISNLTRFFTIYQADAIIVREGGVAKGIITKEDIINSVFHHKGDISSLLAKDVMTSPLISIESDKYLDEVIAFMNGKNLTKVPIKRELDIVGIFVHPEELIAKFYNRR